MLPRDAHRRARRLVQPRNARRRVQRLGRRRNTEAPVQRGAGTLAPNLHFWRDNHGLEIDLVFEQAGRLHAVECKSGVTYTASWFDPVRRWRSVVGPEAADPIVVYGGDQGHRGADYHVMSWRDVGALRRSSSRMQ